jgi:hypothetical protein
MGADRLDRNPVSRTRRIIVISRFGRSSGQKAVLDPGRTLRIGRTDRADLAIPQDGYVSALHCELSWDGGTCCLKDLGSMTGTQLDGLRIEGEARVSHGDWIQIGQTVLSVYFEAFTPPPSVGPRTPTEAARADEARAALAPLVGRLFGVFDAARDGRVVELLNESVDEHRSLYEGAKGDGLADVAPYLVRFRSDSELLDRVVGEGWGRAFGIFVESTRPFLAVRRHLRRLLIVEEAETAMRMYFRFYDPRALRDFLPLATVRQRADLLEDIDAFLYEGEDGALRRFDASAAAAEARTDSG